MWTQNTDSDNIFRIVCREENSSENNMKLITDFVNQTLYQKCKNSRGWFPLRFILCTYYRHLLPWLSSLFSALSVWSKFCVFMPAALSVNPPQVNGDWTHFEKTAPKLMRWNIRQQLQDHISLLLLASYSSAAFGPLYDPFFFPIFNILPAPSLLAGTESKPAAPFSLSMGLQLIGRHLEGPAGYHCC